MKAFVLSGGAYHDFQATTPILLEYLRDHVADIHVCESHSDFLDVAPSMTDYRLIVLHSLYFSGNGATLTKEARAALGVYLEGGGALFVMHAAIGNWDNWEGYLDIAGGLWKWNESSHDPYGLMTLQVREDRELTAGVSPRFRIHDEKYMNLRLRDGIRVLVDAIDADGSRHPHMWINPHPQARIVTLVPGHAAESWRQPDFAHLFHNSCRWLLQNTR